jgi:hypothetical protein
MNNQNIRLHFNEMINLIKDYRSLVFWLIWGITMGVMFGIILEDFKTSFIIFMGYGIFLGLIIQFVKLKWLKSVAVLICLVIAVILVWKPVVSFFQVITNQKISRHFLVADVRQMASILETTHPDPYYHGGGKIAFHRRMQNLIRNIPEDGLTKTEFYRQLCPFVAAVKDGHTSLWEPYQVDNQSPGGIPLYFQAVEDFFYVAGVIDPKHQDLIGSKLVSVEIINVDELLERQTRIKGCDNKYQLMRNLGYDGSLWYMQRMRHLIPEWKGDSISVVLMKPEGDTVRLNFRPNNQGQDQLILAPTSVNLPSIEKSNYVYDFMDEEKNTAFLRIENMYTYRESFEMDIAHKGYLRKDLANYLYQKYNDKAPPSNHQKVVAGIPSATELCRELVQIMKENQTDNLIIDLRRNQGGNALISTIFFYFFHGKEALISFSDNKSIFVKKYSPLFWKQYPAWNIDEINKHQPIKLTEEDYDFSGYPEYGNNLTREESIRIIEDEASMAATFWAEYQSEKYSAYYCPKNILILCSPVTNSSGYAFMYDHWAGGGKVVGVPSSQAGNNFGAWVGFKLKYSWLKGGISHLYITHFRANPEMGQVFRPDYEMTYENLKSYNFDPNAEVLYTLDLISDL